MGKLPRLSWTDAITWYLLSDDLVLFGALTENLISVLSLLLAGKASFGFSASFLLPVLPHKS